MVIFEFFFSIEQNEVKIDLQSRVEDFQSTQGRSNATNYELALPSSE